MARCSVNFGGWGALLLTGLRPRWLGKAQVGLNEVGERRAVRRSAFAGLGLGLAVVRSAGRITQGRPFRQRSLNQQSRRVGTSREAYR